MESGAAKKAVWILSGLLAWVAASALGAFIAVRLVPPVGSQSAPPAAALELPTGGPSPAGADSPPPHNAADSRFAAADAANAESTAREAATARTAQIERTWDSSRRSVIREAALRRDAESVRILAEAARDDPSPQNRSLAVEALWRAAADGNDDNGRVLDVLLDARFDPSPEVAAMAERSLDDLEALETTREAAAAAEEIDSSRLPGGG